MVKIQKLDNGIAVAMESIPYVKSISFGIWVKNGTRNEKAEENGISHFIEHMLFKGTEKRTAKQIAEEMDALGGQLNAYTTKEYTSYQTRMLHTNFTKALDIMSDMFLNSVFEHFDVEKEKDVIREEIHMYDDSPDELVHDKMQNHIFRGCSLGFPILGTVETIDNLTDESVRAYYEANYHTENTVISVAGYFKEEEMFAELNRVFGQWNRKEKYAPYNTKGRYAVSHSAWEKDIEQLHLCLAFPGIDRNDDMRYALSVFNTIFGGGMSSRLFQKIREDHALSYSIYSYPTAFSDTGSFSIYAGLSEAHLDRVLEMIAEEINRVRMTPLAQAVVNATKEQMISNYIIGAESTMNRMVSAGAALLLKNEILPDDAVIERIRLVEAKDILEICERMFEWGEVSWCSVGKISAPHLERSVKQIY